MNRREGDRRPRPSGLLGALALILAVEVVVARHELDLTTPPRLEWRLSRSAAAREARPCDVLGLGTSMTKLGLLPAVIERQSGFRAYNLAACAGRLPGSYYLLRRALEAGASPEAIVLEVHPTYLAAPFWDGMVAWPDLLDPAECLDLAWTARDPSFFASTMVARTLPSIGARAEVRAATLAALRGESGSTRRNTLPHLRNLTLNSGAFVRQDEPSYGGEVTPYLESMYLPPAWSIHPINRRFLRRILDVCGSRGIRVFWLIPPLTPALQARRELVGLDAAYTRFVERIRRAYPDLVVLDSRRSGYDARAFADAAHLGRRGAVTLSAEVGRILKARLARSSDGPGWIDLPAYRDQPTDVPVESIAQSYRAIQEAGVVAR